MERFRIQWRQGPTLVAREAWVIDLDLMVSRDGGRYLLAKRLQVVAPLDDLVAIGVADPTWGFWRAVVAAAAGMVIRRVGRDELHFDRPSQPFQLAPDLSEAARHARQMLDTEIAVDELVSEFPASSGF
jgi:hypothetical protein